eukprot:8671061-Lingulodinium_polyedra.AAC.1
MRPCVAGSPDGRKPQLCRRQAERNPSGSGRSPQDAGTRLCAFLLRARYMQRCVLSSNPMPSEFSRR